MPVCRSSSASLPVDRIEPRALVLLSVREERLQNREAQDSQTRKPHSLPPRRGPLALPPEAVFEREKARLQLRQGLPQLLEFLFRTVNLEADEFG